ncbi:DUF4124 domain-containing protein [Alteromonas oceanisediminis]|uniref:DUF4124 domain-containing protein n=1 Tax=Alteromonas oceanisediminis TaxID=2836180 RepID=UPI001BDB332C|nr:DUF4124 domain-containing protein [Alteromonas oceanisediminis]MBT0585202.1 DUF4124 domain-containing protein [Alteromonas oceanisediminis]
MLMKRYQRLTTALLIAASSLSGSGTVLAQSVYKVVAEDGSVTYTDAPVSGSTPVDLGRINTAEPLSTGPVVVPAPVNDKQIQYDVVIVSPKPEATLRNNLGEFTVVANATPKPAGAYQLMLDGKAVAANSQGVFKLTGINRGAHQLQVNIVNNTGKILASSPSQTVYLHQASALINSN